jgi:hypothetical protein
MGEAAMIDILLVNPKKQARALFIFFTGGWAEEQKKGFDFYGAANSLPCPSVLVRDLSGNYYNAKNYPDAAAEIAAHCAGFRMPKSYGEDFMPEMLDTGRIVLVGTSMGGYGAIKIAPEIRPDKIILFAPQIRRDKNPFAPDVADRLAGMPCPIDVHICDRSKYPQDRAYAERIREIAPQANIITHAGTAHNVAGEIKKKGQLLELFTAEMPE